MTLSVPRQGMNKLSTARFIFSHLFCPKQRKCRFSVAPSATFWLGRKNPSTNSGISLIPFQPGSWRREGWWWGWDQEMSAGSRAGSWELSWWFWQVLVVLAGPGPARSSELAARVWTGPVPLRFLSPALALTCYCHRWALIFPLLCFPTFFFFIFNFFLCLEIDGKI